MDPNPYAPPTRAAQAIPSSPHAAALAGMCPRCGSGNVHKPSFTWWGGALGPKMFDHHVCRGCGFGFNGKTGESNRNKIIAYTIVVNLIVLAMLAVFWASR